MEGIRLFSLIVAIYLLIFGIGYSGGKFSWEPIPEDDWEVTEDSVKGIRDAVILFEKITADDRKASEGKCYYTVYKRIRILSAEGRKWGEVTLPYFHEKQKIKKIMARTVLPGGKEIPLSQSDILEKDFLKSKGVKIKQKSFSLPGMTDDCIIEYYIHYFLPNNPSVWTIQKDIYLKKAEYNWKFFRLKFLQQLFNPGLAYVRKENVNPNYLWLNIQEPVTVAMEQIPSADKPEEFIFRFEDVPGFEPEPYSPPFIALKAILLCYYGGSETPAEYWKDLHKSLKISIDDFTKTNNPVQEITKQFGEMTTREDTIRATYSWLQKNIKNLGYDDYEDKKIKENKNIDDVLERRYGTTTEINKTFCGILRQIGINTYMVYTINRLENILMYDAKYWQFDRSAVAVPNIKGEYDVYSPGDRYLNFGNIYWAEEDSKGFLIDDSIGCFITLPYSDAHSNYVQILSMSGNMKLNGRLIESHRGHSAHNIRLRSVFSTEEEMLNYLRDNFSKDFPYGKADSFQVENVKEIEKPVTIQCQVNIDLTGHRTGNRFLIKPCILLSSLGNPFYSEKRKYPIMFNYAGEFADSISIELPVNWEVEALPADTSFSNEVGYCLLTFKNFADGKIFSVHRKIRINAPDWETAKYHSIKTLYEMQKSFEEMTVVLRMN